MPTTPIAKETGERILQMTADRTNASLTIRHIPEVIQGAIDSSTKPILKVLQRLYESYDCSCYVTADTCGECAKTLSDTRKLLGLE